MPLSDLPPVSAIIPSKNRPADLESTVRTLISQTILPKQLIIVDQSFNDESRRRIERLCTSNEALKKKMDLDYIWDVQISGLAAARNRAMSLAAGEIWLFLDDDVRLEPNFVEEIVAAYRSRPEAVGVSGIVTNYKHPTAAFRYWSGVFVCGPFHDDRQPIYWNSENLRLSGPIPVSRLGGGLMSFRAAAIRDLRFDENLRGVCDGEDVDFCSQLTERSLLLIAPLARLTHNQSPVGRSDQHWLSRDARANYFLYRKNWSEARVNRLCFIWLNLGYSLIACLSSLRRRSFGPWRDLIEAAREANAIKGVKGRQNLPLFCMGKTEK